MERILKKRRGEGGIVPHHLTRNLSRWVSREHLGGQVDDRCVGDQVVDTATVLSEDVEAIDDKIDQADARQTGDQPVDEHSEDAATEESSRRSRFKIDDLGVDEVLTKRLAACHEEHDLEDKKSQTAQD